MTWPAARRHRFPTHHPRARTRGRALMAAAAVTALAAGTAAGAATPATAAPSVAPAAGAPTAAAPSAVAAYTRSAADRRIISALRSRVTSTRFGSQFSGAVIDADSNSVVWYKNWSMSLMPASATKLVTAHNALTRFGTTTRFTTTVREGKAVKNVLLVGVGDPSLSSAQLTAMAETTAADLLARGITDAGVFVDDDFFPAPTLAPGWLPEYVPDSITPVRALVRDQRDVSDTSADAGRYFRDRLKAFGVTNASYRGRWDAPAGSRIIASSTGGTVADMVNAMLLQSDNEIAETLHKLVGIAQNKGATWDAARTAQAGMVRAAGLQTTALYDGSGLSRWNRLTGIELARIVDRGTDKAYPSLWPMRNAKGMPTAGRTGTLQTKYGRFTTKQSKCAVGRVWAKTGSLRDAAVLAGYTTGKDGRRKVFAFIVNGRTNNLELRQNLDMLAATVNGCY